MIDLQQFSFENQGTNTYLVYKFKEDDIIDSMSLGMLINNKITGFADTLFTQMDSSKFIKYNISSKVSVEEFFSGSVNKKRLVGVLEGIANAIISAEEYMIDINSIVFDLNYMFVDVSSCNTVLICLPIATQVQDKIDMGEFLKKIVYNTQFDRTENCNYIAEIINFMNSTPIINIKDFKNLLDRICVASTVKQSTIKTVDDEPAIITNRSNFTAHDMPSQNKTLNSNVQPHIAKELIGHPLPQPKSQTNVIKDEEKISLFYLLQHYNKDNAKLYKQQKLAKKAQKKQSQTRVAVHTVTNDSRQPAISPELKKLSSYSKFSISGQSIPMPNPAVLPVSQPIKRSFEPTVNETNYNQPPYSQSIVHRTSSNQPIILKGQPMNFGETTLLGGEKIGETTVLDASQTNEIKTLAPVLIRKKNNERIDINKPVYRIGKEKSYVDYFVSDNTAVSRSHANIITREGQYFIVDTNSTNHTYLNGTMIQSNLETKINDRDKIRLANEDFEFRIL